MTCSLAFLYVFDFRPKYPEALSRTSRRFFRAWTLRLTRGIGPPPLAQPEEAQGLPAVAGGHRLILRELAPALRRHLAPQVALHRLAALQLAGRGQLHALLRR